LTNQALNVINRYIFDVIDAVRRMVAADLHIECPGTLVTTLVRLCTCLAQRAHTVTCLPGMKLPRINF
jgi:hypothetical protein